MSDAAPSRRKLLRRSAWVAGVTEGVRIALESIRANAFRSGLTILGVGIGVGVVVLMAALITGIRTSVQEGIEGAGPRNLFVARFDVAEVQLLPTAGRPSWWGRPPITAEEARRVAALPAVQSAVLSVELQDPGGGGGGMTLEYRGVQISGVSGVAESVEWPEYRRATFIEGRSFVQAEVDEGRAVVVLSRQVALDLLGDTAVTGLRVAATAGSARRLPLTVVGVIDPGENLFEEETYLAVLPYTTARRRMGVSDQAGLMVVVPHEDVDLDAAEDQVIGLMRSLRGLSPGEENNFSVLRSTQLLALFDRFTAVFFMVMLALSSVGLMVGGVGVVGIMLISVTERTREIGIRKSLGATRAEILWQFLVEASVLTFIGGAAGLAIGGLGARAVAAATPIPAAVPLWAVLVSLLMAALTGMVFGLAPAARAARLDPVVALRSE